MWKANTSGKGWGLQQHHGPPLAPWVPEQYLEHTAQGGQSIPRDGGLGMRGWGGGENLRREAELFGEAFCKELAETV